MTQLFDWNWCWKCQLKNLFTATNSHHLLRWWNQIILLYPYKHSTTVSFNYKINPIIQQQHKIPFWHIRFFLIWEARSQLLVMKHINKVVEHIVECLRILRFLKNEPLWTQFARAFVAPTLSLISLELRLGKTYKRGISAIRILIMTAYPNLSSAFICRSCCHFGIRLFF